jgi:CotH kinase protein
MKRFSFTFLLIFLCFCQSNAQFSSSNLPLFVINTDGGIGIQDSLKIKANLGIIYKGTNSRNFLSDPKNIYNGNIGIETRGASTAYYDQKSFSFEFRDAVDSDTAVSILDLPIGSDFALRAPYADKSLFRDALSYHLAGEMGEYAPRTRFCEVILNGSYEGFYELAELIKRDSNRVNISKLKSTDIEGEELTGGYIFKVDRDIDEGFYVYPPPGVTESGQFMQYVYPKATNIQPEQIAYLKGYIDSFQIAVKNISFYDTLVGWRHFAEETSFIDHFLLNELARNVDSYRLSGFYHKSKNGKLKAGPQWDHNFSWRNADYCEEFEYYGWTYDECWNLPFWWKYLLQDTVYQENMRCRWKELRSNVWSEQHIFAVIDSMSSLVQDAQVRHFDRWDILGKYVWPNPAPLAKSHREEIINMKQWISRRLRWLDLNIKGRCGNEPIYVPTPGVWKVKPSLATDFFEVEFYGTVPFNTYIECRDMSGRLILSQKLTDVNVNQIPIVHWAESIYIVTVLNKNNGIVYKQEKIVKMK